VFEQVPILRVLFCDGSTASLTPSDLWRGRSTVGSVLETVVRVLRDGIEQAWEVNVENARFAGADARRRARMRSWREATVFAGGHSEDLVSRSRHRPGQPGRG